MLNFFSEGIMHWQWDANIVEFFNRLTENDFVCKLFQGISYLGTEYVVIALFGITYWIFDKKMAKDIGLSVFVAMLFNGLFKGIVNRQRPFQQFPDQVTIRDESILYDSRETFVLDGKEVLRSTSTSFPSGHSQNVGSIFNAFAFELNDRKKMPWLYVVANVLALLVLISRLALGAHFFTDVVVGYTLGLLIVIGIRWLRKKVNNDNLLFLVVIGVFGLITFLSPVWSKESKDMFTVFGSTVGIYVGCMFEEKKVDFKPVKCWYKAVIRLVLGVGLAIGIKTGFKYVYKYFIEEGSYLFNLCDMIRYFLMTFVACGLYPILIKKWKFLND